MSQYDSFASMARSSPPDEFWILFTIAMVIGLACGYGIFYFVRRARIIQDTPTSKIRSAVQGYVEVIGKLKYLAKEPVVAPLTGSACAWYHYKIEEERKTHTSKGTQTSWHTIEEQTSDRAFQCEDDTGVSMVDPRNAEIHPAQSNSWYGHSRWPSSGPGTSRGFFSSSGRFRYSEERLHQDDPLYILGLFRTIDPNKAHGDLNEQTRTLLKLWKQDQATLLEQFDTNNDGQIDPQEWENVRQAAELKASQQMLSRADRPSVNMITKTGDFRRPFIISTKPQEKMIRNFKLKAFACTVGFVLLAPSALWLLIMRMSG